MADLSDWVNKKASQYSRLAYRKLIAATPSPQQNTGVFIGKDNGNGTVSDPDGNIFAADYVGSPSLIDSTIQTGAGTATMVNERLYRSFMSPSGKAMIIYYDTTFTPRKWYVMQFGDSNSYLINTVGISGVPNDGIDHIDTVLFSPDGNSLFVGGSTNVSSVSTEYWGYIEGFSLDSVGPAVTGTVVNGVVVLDATTLTVPAPAAPPVPATKNYTSSASSSYTIGAWPDPGWVSNYNVTWTQHFEAETDTAILAAFGAVAPKVTQSTGVWQFTNTSAGTPKVNLLGNFAGTAITNTFYRLAKTIVDYDVTWHNQCYDISHVPYPDEVCEQVGHIEADYTYSPVVYAYSQPGFTSTTPCTGVLPGPSTIPQKRTMTSAWTSSYSNTGPGGICYNCPSSPFLDFGGSLDGYASHVNPSFPSAGAYSTSMDGYVDTAGGAVWPLAAGPPPGASRTTNGLAGIPPNFCSGTLMGDFHKLIATSNTTGVFTIEGVNLGAVVTIVDTTRVGTQTEHITSTPGTFTGTYVSGSWTEDIYSLVTVNTGPALMNTSMISGFENIAQSGTASLSLNLLNGHVGYSVPWLNLPGTHLFSIPNAYTDTHVESTFPGSPAHAKGVDSEDFQAFFFTPAGGDPDNMTITDYPVVAGTPTAGDSANGDGYVVANPDFNIWDYILIH